MQIVQQSKPQETETPLNNESKIIVINFHTVNWIGNILIYTEIPYSSIHNFIHLGNFSII